MDRNKIEEGVRLILEGIGEDINREGLLETPARIARMYEEICGGMHEDASVHLQKTFTVDKNELVLEKDITFYSSCEHHMLPFFGKVHVAYIPNHHVTGLSKIARVVDVISHRLQLQERMTLQIKDCIQETLNPLGVMVVVEAQHMCMQMRGVEKQGSITTTSDFCGAFNQAKTREEFLSLIRMRG